MIKKNYSILIVVTVIVRVLVNRNCTCTSMQGLRSGPHTAHGAPILQNVKFVHHGPGRLSSTYWFLAGNMPICQVGKK